MIDVLVKWCYSSKIHDDMRTKLGLTANEDEEEEEEIGIAGGLLAHKKERGPGGRPFRSHEQIV
jgi:hypothetical protein